MGYDSGFDFCWDGESDLDEPWNAFLDKIRTVYKSDSNVKLYDSAENRGIAVQFQVGEAPSLPFHYQYFKRFSSKVSGIHCGGAEDYINQVTEIASDIFGPVIVRPWNEYSKVIDNQVHTWTEVYDTDNNYQIFLAASKTKSANT